MKKTILLATGFLLLLAVSCTDKEGGNKAVIQQNTTSPADEMVEKTVRYVAEDGTSTLVTFKDSEAQHSISIKSNNATISAVQKSKTENGAIYEDHDFVIESKNDSIIITQGDNIIELRKARESKN